MQRKMKESGRKEVREKKVNMCDKKSGKESIRRNRERNSERRKLKVDNESENWNMQGGKKINKGEDKKRKEYKRRKDDKL